MNDVFFTGYVNKPGVKKHSTNGKLYTFMSVGIREYNGAQQSSEFINVLISAWEREAEQLTGPDAAGCYIFEGKIKSFQKTDADGTSRNITHFSISRAHKVIKTKIQGQGRTQGQASDPFNPHNRPVQQTMAPNQPATVSNQPAQPQKQYDDLPF